MAMASALVVVNFLLVLPGTVAQCPRGTFASAGSCPSCPSGRFTYDVGSTSCPACPLGSFSDKERSSQCTACPEGMTTLLTVSRSHNDCGLFKAGGTGNANDKGTVAQCGKGTFASAGSCPSCPSGRFTDNVGSTTCPACPLGTFSDKDGSSQCTACPKGMTTLMTVSQSHNDCGLYNAGRTGNANDNADLASGAVLAIMVFGISALFVNCNTHQE